LERERRSPRLAPTLPQRVVAVDHNEECLAQVRDRLLFAEVSRESVYALDFDDRSFDLVLCLEVLEHLERPGVALEELRRVCRRDLVLSVPHEPFFRLGSLARGKYWRMLGRHPEHLRARNRRTFRAFLVRHVEVRELTIAFPWLIAHCRPPGSRVKPHANARALGGQ